MKSPQLSISFSTLIKNYQKAQSRLVSAVRALASQMSSATPGSFILLQFQMSQVTQVGESISNLIAQVNSMISAAIRNQKTQ
ncbi:MAG: hypothetical protein RL235_735 [Chlamydiota bacterium]|jgi:hypothetical protein